jgi:phage baseplate assembly protein W
MRDILGTDIKLTNWDITIADGDIELVSGVECVKQDLLHAFQTPLYFWGMSIEFGSRLQEFVNGGDNPFFIADLRRAVNEVFQKEPRVQKDSWKINIFKRSDGIRIECDFLPIEQETPETIEFIIDKAVN